MVTIQTSVLGTVVTGVLASALAVTGLVGCSTAPTGPAAPPDLELPVAFALQRDQEELSSTAMARSTPGDPLYRTWLDTASIASAYGASASVAESVLDQLRAVGFDGDVHPTNGLVVGSMTVAEADAFLGTNIITTDVDGFKVARPAEPPRVPRSLQNSVTAVVGLTLMFPVTPPAAQSTPAPNEVTCAPAPEITAQIAAFYGLAPVVSAGRGGQGTTIAMLQTDQSSPRALQVFSECYDVRIPPVQTITVDTSDPSVFGDTAQESTLDIIAASLIAPNLDAIQTYQFNPRTSLVFPLAEAIGDALEPGGPDIISTSIGVCETAVRPAALELGEWLLASAAAAGITVVAASGDTGSSSCVPNDTSESSQYPASSPFVTGVGGTEPVRDGAVIVDQQVWNTAPQPLNAGGGATTSQFDRPEYQRGIDLPGGRLVPDLAFVAAPATFGPIPVCSNRGQCSLQIVGGTSATAPGLAAAVSELMDALAPGETAEPQQLGLLNPAIYALAEQPAGRRVFMDVTTGDNDLYGVGCCTAQPGYDAASGWGSVNFAELLNELPR